MFGGIDFILYLCPILSEQKPTIGWVRLASLVMRKPMTRGNLI